MNRKKLSIFTLLLIGFTVVMVTTVYARHLGFRWPNVTVPMRNFNYNTVWQPAMLTGINNWNTRNTPITFQTNTTSSNTITASRFDDEWYGLISYQRNLLGLGSSITRFDISLNARTIANSATNTSNFITSVFAHELGHVIGLSDNPSNTAPNGSIMNQSRNRNTLTVPTTFDVESVNMLY